MHRPQFPMPAALRGFIWQPCMYQFDPSNTPAFAGIALATGVETGHVPLKLDDDAPFLLLGIKIENTAVNFRLWDPFGNPLIDDDLFVAPIEYANNIQPFTVLEGPGIMCPAGSVLEVRLQGQ